MGCVPTFEAEEALAGVAVRLGAEQVAGWSEAEQRLADAATYPSEGEISQVRSQILAGEDPLGEAFCRLRGPAQRRPSGQTFTPGPVIRGMVGWAARTLVPARVVNPGTGSARFLAAAGRRWPETALLGVETDPLAAMLGRATLAAAGMAGRAGITLGDYRSLRLAPAAGPTLFLGNPPYVRHHQIPPGWKSWLRSAAASQGLAASGLAGLHVHFFLATALHAVPGDAGVLVTAAEWLDVNYGSLVRSLLLGPLGGQSVHLLDPAVPAFTDAAATTAITCFLPGSHPASLRLRRVARLADLGELAGGTAVPAPVLCAASRWTPLVGRAAQEIGTAGAAGTTAWKGARSAGAAGGAAEATAWGAVRGAVGAGGVTPGSAGCRERWAWAAAQWARPASRGPGRARGAVPGPPRPGDRRQQGMGHGGQPGRAAQPVPVPGGDPGQRAVPRRGHAGDDRAAALGHRSPGGPGGAGARRAHARDPVPGRGRGGRGGGLLHRLPPQALVAGAAAGARPHPRHLHGAAAARVRAQPRRGQARQHRPRPLPTRAAAAGRPRRAGRLPAPVGHPGAGAHLRRRADQVRAG